MSRADLVLGALAVAGTASVVLVLAGGRQDVAVAAPAGPAAPSRSAEAEDRGVLAESAAPDRSGATPVGRREAPSSPVGAVAEPAPPSAEEGAFESDAVYGVVLDPRGLSVDGAEVELRERDGGPGARRPGAVLDRGVTDAGGRFRFRGVEAHERYALSIRHPGFALFLGEADAGEDEELVLTPSSDLRVRVVARGTGAPVAGARVGVEQEHWVGDELRDQHVVETDETGVALVPSLAAGAAYEYAVSHGDHVPRVAHVAMPVAEAAPAGEPVEVTVRLEAGRELPLELVELGGGPVAGGEVFLGGLSLGRADAGGRLALRIPSDRTEATGSWTLRARAEGFLETRRPVSLGELATADALVLPMLEGGVLRGRVADPEGRPVAGARLTVRSPNRVDPLARTAAAGARFASVERSAVMSDEEGAFRWPGLAAGDAELHVQLQAEGFVPEFLAAPLPAPGEEAWLEITLRPSGTVLGVVRSEGEPVPARVEGWVESTAVATRTNDGGEFRLEGVPAGEVALAARSLSSYLVRSARDEAQTTVALEAGAEVRVELTLATPEGVELAGRVLDERGDPVAGARVSASRWNDGTVDFDRGRSDAEGRWSLRVSSEPGSGYGVTAQVGQRRVHVRDVAPGRTDVELRFGARGEVPVAVVDAATGRPLPAAELRWRLAGEDGWRRVHGASAPGPDGFRRLPVEPGVADVRAELTRENYLPAVERGVSVPPGSASAPVRLALVRGAELRLRLVADGELSAMPRGARLVRVDDGDELRPFHPDDGGTAVVRAVAPGRYRLEHELEGVRFEPAELVVEGAGTVEREVRFDGDPSSVEEPGKPERSLRALGYR